MAHTGVVGAVGDEAVTRGLVMHTDTGGPMKAIVMVVPLERLGVLPSVSRPRVRNASPSSEALFPTLKPLADRAASRAWVDHLAPW